jgi:hypothetical protein
MFHVWREQKERRRVVVCVYAHTYTQTGRQASTCIQTNSFVDTGSQQFNHLHAFKQTVLWIQVRSNSLAAWIQTTRAETCGDGRQSAVREACRRVCHALV